MSGDAFERRGTRWFTHRDGDLADEAVLCGPAVGVVEEKVRVLLVACNACVVFTADFARALREVPGVF